MGPREKKSKNTQNSDADHNPSLTSLADDMESDSKPVYGVNKFRASLYMFISVSVWFRFLNTGRKVASSS